MSEILLSRLSDFLGAQIGLHFPPERWPDLERGIGAVAREFGFDNSAACVQWLLASPLSRNQIEVLAAHLTVGETYFFRDRKTFELLEGQILPELIRSRRATSQRLRIWSAGCASGEEPYSIAILLHKLIPDLEDWNLTILATDINARGLHKAAEGVYADWSFRDTPCWVREAYFSRAAGNRVQIIPSIQKLVSFSYLNMAEDAYPSLPTDTNAMDVIFCRNVLMYFAPERQKKVAGHLHRALVEGGWLMVSPSEVSHILFSQFRTVHFPSATLYLKDSENTPNLDLVPCLREEPVLELPTTTFLPPDPEPPAVFDPGVSESFPVVTEGPGQAEPQASLYEKALPRYQEGRFVEAVEKLTSWLSQHPDDTTATCLLARAYANAGHLVRALEWCEKAFTVDKLNAGCHYLRAMILQEQGALEEAKVSLQRTLYLDPRFVVAHFSLGNLALRQRRTKEAEKHFENALSLLQAHRTEDILPESDGMTAGRLMEIIRSTVHGVPFS